MPVAHVGGGAPGQRCEGLAVQSQVGVSLHIPQSRLAELTRPAHAWLMARRPLPKMGQRSFAGGAVE